ncbi:WW domain-containing adapter protein with coiled-coil-like protein [Leptotrombidium deliense]|uniref:WW domain-containing adapter protein with coiled-coil-like protein n=1 Tax=Leptotrombidium deliense TaxID=299467 RepID=A0A443SVB0_9ACAR|nr:WW domain-containing adapter protein with coiled-coil-like protein [Leptotrombidium deliense]
MTVVEAEVEKALRAMVAEAVEVGQEVAVRLLRVETARVKDRDRARDRDKERDRERDRNRDRDKERDRERERERLRERDKRERTRERDRFHDRKDGSRSAENNSSSYGSEKSSNSTNHGPSSREKVKSEDGKRTRVGDWTEYMSSSSDKVYYYNCKTRVSQWEKPKEWIEYENSKKEEKASHSRVVDKHSMCVKNQASTSVDSEDTRRDLDLNNVNSNTCVTAKSQNDVSMNPRDPRRVNAVYNSNANSVNTDRKKAEEMKNTDAESNCNTSPTLRVDYRNSVNCKDNCNSEEKQNAVSTSRNAGSNPLGTANHDILSPSDINSWNLPKIMSQFGLTHLSTQDALKTLSQVLQLTSKVSRNNQQTISGQRPANVNSPLVNTPLQTVRESPSSTSAHSRHHQSRHSHQHQKHNHNQSHMHSHSHYHHSQHHQSADGIRHELDLLMNRNWGQSPNSDVSVNSSTRSPTSSITSITPGISSSIRPSLPSLTPSLANYFREDLVSHVVGWPTEQLEKQVQRYSADAHNTGSLDATRVSAELKMARSLVRLTEIQATLQEQRILFLRQQIQDVEEWKSQNTSH